MACELCCLFSSPAVPSHLSTRASWNHLLDKAHPGLSICSGEPKPRQGLWGSPSPPRPFTYGGDNRACKEETAAEVPVAGVGGVAFGVHTLHPGFHDDLCRGGVGWGVAGGRRKRQLRHQLVAKLSAGCFPAISFNGILSCSCFHFVEKETKAPAE